MPVLSFSIHCAGEQSPTSKSILEETTLLQVDCPRQREGDKLSLSVLNSKPIVLEGEQAQQLPEDGAEVDTFKESTGASSRLIDGLPNAICSPETPLPNTDCCQFWQGNEQSRKDNGKNGSFLVTDSSVMIDCSLSTETSDEEASFCKEKLLKEEVEQCTSVQEHSFPLLHCNGEGSCPDDKQGTERLETICSSSGNKLPVNDICSNEIIGDKNGNASNSAISLFTVLEDSHGEEEEHLGIVHEPIDLAFQSRFEPCDLSVQEKNNEFFSISVSSEQTEAQHQSCNQGDCGPVRAEYVEDHTVALWVKWRGKWQTGFQCPRIDCPFQTLRAKPTHDRKKYIAIFFPRTRTYSWADMLLIRSINEFPEPLASGTHRKWRKLVKDLTTPRRYIMQKLSVAMLNISDQLHTEAVVENARKAATWLEFAMEASTCRDYSDLGRMLLKLQTMILPSYMTDPCLENSWEQKCKTADSAESIEILTKELMASVQWSKVEELWNSPMQPELGPEWKTWKQEAMKRFSTSHPIIDGADMGQRSFEVSVSMEAQNCSKRTKFEVRRAESCASRMEASECRIFSQADRADTDSGHSICQANIGSTVGCQPHKVEAASEVATPVNSSTVGVRWNEIPDTGECLNLNQNSVQTSTDRRVQNAATATAAYQYRQCSAFIVAKGRQCGRWASDGDDCCCVHSSAFSLGKSPQDQRPPPDAPMCQGLTTHGQKCKHRARLSSTFCKKHRLQRTTHHSVGATNISNSSEGKFKRKLCENNAIVKFSSSNASDSEIFGLRRDLKASSQENLIPIIVGETLDERNCLMKESELNGALPTQVGPTTLNFPICIGYCGQNDSDPCLEKATRHTLYCEKHIPKFLKRARDGKSRLVSKDVFINLLKSCSSRQEKLQLHQACELLYVFMKRSLSCQKSVFKGEIMDWILSESSKNEIVGQHLLKLVSCEREKIMRLWGFDADKEEIPLETNALLTSEVEEKDHSQGMTVKCKMCTEEFSSDQILGAHWTEIHKKEARWLFRGYACAVCMNSFTNRKVLESHVKERHGIQFLEHSMLFRCMSCNNHYVNPEQLWQHVLSSHLAEFQMADYRPDSYHSQHKFCQPKTDPGSNICQTNGVSVEEEDSQRYTCRFCGLKFDLLPDLGRHHQVAHMNASSVNQFKVNQYVKHNRHSHPRFNKGFGSAFRFKKQTDFGMHKRFSSSDEVLSLRPRLRSQATETIYLGRLSESHCAGVAETLFSEMQKTKPRPSNTEILSIARSACCKINLHAAVEGKYGVQPENLYLKAAKLCSELNIQVSWHLEDFICPNRCKALYIPHSLTSMKAIPDGILDSSNPTAESANDTQWEMEECHYILDRRHFNWKSLEKSIILCEDVSFGKERVPVACVVDAHLKDMLNVNIDEISHCKESTVRTPWHGFTYVTKRLIGPCLDLDKQNSHLGCSCPPPKCSPEKCDHVYLFDNDYENAEDIHGKSMHGRFPYDEEGRILLEEGYLVYECNSSCNCDTSCQNRVLQRGLQVKLEIFRTENKGWAVRAGEAISRGTFVCEYIGQVLNDVEGHKREERLINGEGSYFFDINAHIDVARGPGEGTVPYIIDSTKFGNVSRFINHSCSPNLVNYLVLVESMDCQLAHIGLYASRDIARGEEIAFDYRHELLPGGGLPCHCGVPNCRGRLY